MTHGNTRVCAISAVLLAVVISGCASKPTTADAMRAHGDEPQARLDLKNLLAGDWERGDKMVSDGERDLNRAERDYRRAERALRDAREKQEDARRRIAEGQRLKRDSESRFRETFPDLQLGGGRR